MLKRSAFARQRPERVRTYPSPIPEHLRRSAVITASAANEAQAIEKPQKLGRGASERQHKAKLVLMGCMVCRRLFGQHDPGPVELHHLRGGGWGKGDWMTLIPLCPEHHRGQSGVHGLGTKGFHKHYGFDQSDLLADVHKEIKGESHATN